MDDFGPGNRAAWKQAVYCFFTGHLAAFRALPREEVKRIAEAASECASGNPLHMMRGPFGIHGYRDDLTGAGVTAVLIAGIYRLQNEDPDLCFALFNDWPDLPMYALLAGNAHLKGCPQ